MDETPFSSGAAHWIWVPGFDDELRFGQFVLFRKTVHVDEVPTNEVLGHVSADTRYRLYLNGQCLSVGPCKSYPDRWNYETINLTPALVKGRNVLAAKVLRFSSSQQGCLSMMRTALPGFIFHCDLPGQGLVVTDTTWKSRIDESVQLVDTSEWDYSLGPPFLNLNEMATGDLSQGEWLSHQFDEGLWPHAVVKTSTQKMSPTLDPRRLQPRQIPAMEEREATFDSAVVCSGPVALDQWNDLIRDGAHIAVPAGAALSVDIQVEKLTTGYLDFVCDYDGAIEDGPRIEFLCAECYEPPPGDGKPRIKGDRTNFVNGDLHGPSDSYAPHPGRNHYSPFWFRTFRYIRITVPSSPGQLTLVRFSYRSTHYPLDIRSSINTSSALLTKLWDISITTIRNCLHETYEDCPFYEQNQFAMDSRSQALFTYVLSGDDRLARKMLQEFYASRRDDGLLETHFPSPSRGLNIPTFSLFWVLAVYDHMVHFGDVALVRKYIGAVDDVLDYFDKRINDKGLVGRLDHDCWPFVDWVGEWATPALGFKGLAVPPAYYTQGCATFHSLIYSYALLKSSELCTFLGRRDTADEYLSRHRILNGAVHTHCYDAQRGVFLDGPGVTDQLSQHVQIFAVLSGCCDSLDDAQNLMRKTIFRREELHMAKASLAMSFYTFRAVSQASVYEESWPVLIRPWETMISHNLTTWAESETMMRSDCHGWSATPLYEIVTEIIGVKQRSHEYLRRFSLKESEVAVEPKTSLAKEMEGTIYVGDPNELVRVRWGEGEGFLSETFNPKSQVP